MNSALVPFDEFLEDLKDQTGIVNMTPLLEKIRRFVFKAEREIGYAGTVVLKKIPYENDGTNFDGTRIWLPKDWLEFYTILDDDGEVDLRSYIVSGNYLHFCDGKTRTKAELYYYGLMCDGFGNPLITRNHQQANVDYCKWRIKSPMAFMSNSRQDRILEKDYEQDWKDSRDASRGNDAWPSNEQDWAWLSTVGNMSAKDSMIYYIYNDVESMCALEAKTECSLREAAKTMRVFNWQYDSLTDDITLAPGIDISWLEANTSEATLATMVSGTTIPYDSIGRIAMAIQGGSEKEYQIFDILNGQIDDIVFDFYRNETLKLDIFISKEFYSHANIFLKLKES